MEQEHDPAEQAAIQDAIRRMEWEGPALPGSNPTINPDLGKVEVGSNPTTHPLRNGRIRIPEVSGIATVQVQQVNQQ